MMSTGDLITHLAKTEKGTHILFRDFGLTGTDEASILTRTSIQNEVSKWYPEARVKSCEVVSSTVEGHFEFNIEVEGE